MIVRSRLQFPVAAIVLASAFAVPAALAEDMSKDSMSKDKESKKAKKKYKMKKDSTKKDDTSTDKSY